MKKFVFLSIVLYSVAYNLHLRADQSTLFVAGKDNYTSLYLPDNVIQNRLSDNMNQEWVLNNTQSKITWIIPDDGGTPRDISRIVQTGPQEFNIRTSYEEGGKSPLNHAISRMDLICHNESQLTLPVTLHLDLSGDGKRTDYDRVAESGMALRDFVFVQTPGKSWQQVDGKTAGWIATVSFEAPPGDTKVGLSPWYNYSDYLNFVNTLPKYPYLKKDLIGKSEGGREQWELTITDPGVDPKEKQKIFWHTREHGYETFSSFAMESLVRFLLSDEAVEYRKQYIFILHPMTNVDGVAQGFEYRGGYDFPDPHGTNTARLLFGAMDRIQPDFAITWHNWIAPRDRNNIFYTDGENGKPTPRAWIRFSQLFPSLRFAGHRWKDEGDSLKYNWEGRSLSLYNVHQYAMKKYGTRVWGWEMSWWNYKVEDAYKAGSSFARAFLTTLGEIKTGTVPKSVSVPVFDIPRWKMHEFSATGRAHVDNPFRDGMLIGEFTSPSGNLRVIDGFYDGEDTWRLRFAPDEEGDWSYLLRGEGVEILQHGKFRCTKPDSHGFIRIHQQNPYSFAYDDGTPFFPMGETCYGLHDDSPITGDLRARYLKTRRSQHFNFVRMSVGHSFPHAIADPVYWAWGGSPVKPVLDSINPSFFHSLDQLLLQMKECGMNAEMILLNFYRLPFTDPTIWTPAIEHLWLRYLMARYGAFDNIFMWTISNEYETHPDGKYRLDIPGDIDWARMTARFIKEYDPHNHLVTVHPNISASTLGVTPRDSINPPWRIGEFFGNEKALDVLSQQTGQSGKGVLWDDKLKCWVGTIPCWSRAFRLTVSIKSQYLTQRMVMNTSGAMPPKGIRSDHS